MPPKKKNKIMSSLNLMKKDDLSINNTTTITTNNGQYKTMVLNKAPYRSSLFENSKEAEPPECLNDNINDNTNIEDNMDMEDNNEINIDWKRNDIPLWAKKRQQIGQELYKAEREIKYYQQIIQYINSNKEKLNSIYNNISNDISSLSEIMEKFQIGIKKRTEKMLRGRATIGISGLEKQGKSSFINHWLKLNMNGVDLLPSRLLRCTWSTTHIIYKENPPFIAEIYFYTQNELLHELIHIVKSVEGTIISEKGLCRDTFKPYINRWNTVENSATKFKVETATSIFNNWSEILNYLGKPPKIIEVNDFDSLSIAIFPYISLYDKEKDDMINQINHHVHAVKEVVIKLPIPGGQEFVEIIDMPGIGAPTLRATQEVERVINNDTDLMIFVKNATSPVQESSEETDLLLNIEKSAGDISFVDRIAGVITCADIIPSEEHLKELIKQLSFVIPKEQIFITSSTWMDNPENMRNSSQLEWVNFFNQNIGHTLNSNGYNDFIIFIKEFLENNIPKFDKIITKGIDSNLKNIRGLIYKILQAIFSCGENQLTDSDKKMICELVNIDAIDNNIMRKTEGLYPAIIGDLKKAKDNERIIFMNSLFQKLNPIQKIQEGDGKKYKDILINSWKSFNDMERELKDNIKFENIQKSINATPSVRNNINDKNSIVNHTAQECIRREIQNSARENFTKLITSLKIDFRSIIERLCKSILDAGDNKWKNTPHDDFIQGTLSSIIPKMLMDEKYIQFIKTDSSKTEENTRMVTFLFPNILIFNLEERAKIMLEFFANPAILQLEYVDEINKKDAISRVLGLLEYMKGSQSSYDKAMAIKLKTQFLKCGNTTTKTSGYIWYYEKTVNEFIIEMNNEIRITLDYIKLIIMSKHGLQELFEQMMEGFPLPTLGTLLNVAEKNRCEIWPTLFNNDLQEIINHLRSYSIPPVFK